jgi:hypothetical protein
MALPQQRISAKESSVPNKPGETQVSKPPALPVPDARKEAQRKASLPLDGKPSTEVDANKLGISKRFGNMLNFGNRPRQEQDAKSVTEREGTPSESSEGVQNDTSSEILYPERAEKSITYNDEEEKYNRVRSELTAHGYDEKNFDNEFIDKLRASNFEVKMPAGYITISVFIIVSSILFWLVSILITMAGLVIGAAGLLAGFFTFGIGTLVAGALGSGVKVIGLGMWVMGGVTTFALTIGQIISQIYFLKTASLVLQRTGVLKKYALRLLTIRGITILLGWIPLLNVFIFFGGGRSFWRMAKRETHKVRDIIQKEFEE